MDRTGSVAIVLDHVARQDPPGAAAAAARADPAVGGALLAFCAFMGADGATVPVALGTDADERLLIAAVRALSATKVPNPAGDGALDCLIALAGQVDHRTRLGSFARYVATEAALAAARVDLAHELRCEPRADEVWADHPYAPVMLACAARTEIFAGNISAALALLAAPAPDGVPGDLLRATRAVAAGNAADVTTMRSLILEVQAAHVRPEDHLGRGIHLLLAFGVVALGDALGAVRHLLSAGGGPDLDRLTVIDRVLGYELLVAAAIEEGDLEAALAWEARALPWAEHRAAAPTVLRIRSRVALHAGDATAAEGWATTAIDRAATEGRAVEAAEAEILRARARIAGQALPAAARGLRAAVSSGDGTGHAAVRYAATRVLRPAGRRLPPPHGIGWSGLSPRERDVARSILNGDSNARIAEKLSLSPTTVRAHTTRVLTAFGVATRIGLLAATRGPSAAAVTPPGVTARQGQVAAAVAAGRTNVEVGAELGISVKSVERHVTDVLQRWGLVSRFDLAHHWWSAQEPEPELRE